MVDFIFKSKGEYPKLKETKKWNHLWMTQFSRAGFLTPTYVQDSVSVWQY